LLDGGLQVLVQPVERGRGALVVVPIAILTACSYWPPLSRSRMILWRSVHAVAFAIASSICLVIAESVDWPRACRSRLSCFGARSWNSLLVGGAAVAAGDQRQRFVGTALQCDDPGLDEGVHLLGPVVPRVAHRRRGHQPGDGAPDQAQGRRRCSRRAGRRSAGGWYGG